MTHAQRQQLRQLIDARIRAITGMERCPLGKASETGYRDGCRCNQCCRAANEKRRAREQRQKERLAA